MLWPFGQQRSALVDRSKRDIAVKEAGECETEWIAYDRAMDTKLSEAVNTIEESFAAWLMSSVNFAILHLPYIRSVRRLSVRLAT